MYKKILAAVNEHLNSEVAARYALSLAQASGAKLYTVFAAEPATSPSALRRAEEAMSRLFQAAAEAGIEAEAITGTGDPVRKICGIVRREAVDIVFAATRKADVEKRFYAGTVSRRLSMSLPCSFALVRVVHIGRVRPKEILVPLKARVDRAEERAYFVSKLAQAFEGTVIVFHVRRPISKFFHGEVHLTPLEWEKRLPKDISGFMGHLGRYGIPHRGSSAAGSAGRAITIEAFSKRHDLIVMGASQRSLLSRIIRGNPVEELLRDTPCDLIILRPRHENP
ncbi:MAG: universal stress protein [Thermodesulfovibrionales bacterium]|nr:universal stress protein [Thermodesulfovibrionales bacterium]